MKILFYILATLGFFTALVLLNVEPKLNQQTEYNSSVVFAIQDTREEKGLKEVEFNWRLWESSREKALQIERTCEWDHFIDNEKKFSRLVKQTGQDFEIVGEVLARGFKKPENVVKGWENSPSHAKIVLGDYREFGVYSWKSECDEKIYVVSHFIK